MNSKKQQMRGIDRAFVSWPGVLGLALAVVAMVCAVGCEPAMDVADRAAARAEAKSNAVRMRRSKQFNAARAGVADVRIFHMKRMMIYSGGGVVLHEAGYFLTSAHMMTGIRGGTRLVHLGGEQWYPCRLVAAVDDADMAIMKVRTDRELQPVTFGDGSSIDVGEEVLIIGQPMSQLSMPTWGWIERRSMRNGERFRIVDSQGHRGYSGGGVFDSAGLVIGTVVAVDIDIDVPVDEDIPVDATRVDFIRKAFAEELGDEGRYDYRLGITVQASAEPVVAGVARGGPADVAGVKAGDVLERIGEVRIGDSLHFYVALMELSSDDPVAIRVRRGEEVLPLTAIPQGRPMQPAVEVDQQLVGGIEQGVCPQPYAAVDHFERLDIIETKHVSTISLDEMTEYAGGITAQFNGYIRIPVDGEYVFRVAAERGGEIRIGSTRVAICDRVTGPEGQSTPILLQAGLHPLQVDYYHLNGSKKLEASCQGPGIDKQPIPAAWLFRPVPEKVAGDELQTVGQGDAAASPQATTDAR